jgi:ribosomal protein S18 acetylase RimI-like enzyme
MSNLFLRQITDADTTFLLSLYAETRAFEMTLVPWNDGQKRAFVEAQFNAQHEHYHEHFPNASFDVIVADGLLAGRLYVLRNDEQIRILDIHVKNECRAKGIGSHFIRVLKEEAQAAGKPLRIYIENDNPYMPAFERRGFGRVNTSDGFYVLMECPSPAGKQSIARWRKRIRKARDYSALLAQAVVFTCEAVPLTHDR